MTDNHLKLKPVNPHNKLTVSQVYLNLLANYLEEMEQGQSLCSNSNHLANNEQIRSAQRLTLTQLDKLLSNIESRTGNLAFGLHIGEHIHPSDYGTIGYALMNCPNLQQALRLAVKQKPILNQALTTTLQEQGDDYHYQVSTTSDTRNLAPLIELDFSSLVQLAKFLVGKQKSSDVWIKKVQFQHAALAKIDVYQRIFNCPVEFGVNSNVIIIAKSVLNLPVRSANPQLFKMFQEKLERLNTIELYESSFSQRMFTFLSSCQDNIIPDVSMVAQEFNISISALKKRLQQEGLNYSTICDTIKKNIALKMVTCPNVKIKQIVVSLNFNSASAFNRAFKRWTEMTPTEYRKKSHEKRGEK